MNKARLFRPRRPSEFEKIRCWSFRCRHHLFRPKVNHHSITYVTIRFPFTSLPARYKKFLFLLSFIPIQGRKGMIGISLKCLIRTIVDQ